MATTYTLIDKTTLGSNQASIDFTSIPSTYTDLQVLISPRVAENNVAVNLYGKFNSSSSGYTNKRLYGYGSGQGSDSDPSGGNAFSLGLINGNTSTSSTFGNIALYIPNYAGSNYKSLSVDSVGEQNGTSPFATFTAGLWSNTAAITSISIYAATDLLTNSTAYLYGIKNS
jgi:hypothetical protein